MSRSGRRPLIIRVYRRLMSALMPRLAPQYAEEAMLTFEERYRDARRISRWRGFRFALRDIVADTLTAFAERRSARTGKRVLFRRLVLRHEGASPEELPPESPASGPFLETLGSDIRLAARNLRRSPVFTSVSALLLAIGMGATIFFFSGLNAMLLRTPPHIENADDLFYIYQLDSTGRRSRVSWPDFQDMQQQLDGLVDLAVFGSVWPVVERTSGMAERMHAERVSPDYFTVLGVPLRIGRDFTESDLASGARTAIIGHRLWQDQFGGSADVLGRSLRVNGQDHTVIGVAPRGLRMFGALSQASVWILAEPWIQPQRGYLTFRPVGRLKNGVGIAQIQERCSALAAGLAESLPEFWLDGREEPATLSVLSERETRFSPEYGSNPLPEFVMILVLIMLISAVPCSNVGNLLLARGLRRSREIAVRLSLGARRSRLIRMLLTESTLLAGIAVMLAFALLAVARYLAVVGIGGFQLPAEFDSPIDLRVILFGILIAFLTVVMFGLPPARHASRASLVPALKGEASGSRSRGTRLRNLFVVAQVASSLTLVVIGALALRSYRELRSIDVGFDSQNVVIFPVDLSLRQYEDEAGRRFFDDLHGRLGALPGVESVALGTYSLMSFSGIAYGGVVPLDRDPTEQESPAVRGNLVSPGYFQLHRIPIVRGRDFRDDDDPGSPSVVIVNESFARLYWPDGDPIGKRISLADGAEIIGVVQNTQYHDVSESPEPHVWLPLSRNYRSSASVHVRTIGDPRPVIAAVRREVRSMDATLPLVEAVLLEERVADRLGSERSMMHLMNGIGLVILVMAMIGLYGVVAFAVGQRRRELGIRIALGASSANVLRLIVLEGIRLTAKGVMLGILLVLLIIPLMKSLFYGVVPFDPLAVLGAVVLLTLTAGLASLPAAVRATRVDPVTSMRTE
jgi:predicted permease